MDASKFLVTASCLQSNCKFTEPFVCLVEFVHAMDIKPGRLKVKIDFKSENRTTEFKQRIFKAYLLSKIFAGTTKIRLKTDRLNLLKFPLELFMGRAKLKIQFYYKKRQFLKFKMPLKVKYNQEDMRLMPPPAPCFANLVMSNKKLTSKKYYKIKWN